MSERDSESLKDLDARLKAAQARERLTEAPLGKTAQVDQRAVGVGVRIAIELLSGLLVGLGVGYALDRWLGTRPWLMLAFFFLGTAAGFMNVLRAVRSLEQRKQPGSDGKS
ncbi:MAG: AtpZ/AtpI family protein [Burkholderiales bacterium]|nr:AtpZ/AtpI family protein [Burkholderiales bacterium]